MDVVGVHMTSISTIVTRAISILKLPPNNWVAGQELKLSYYIGETLFFFTIYTHYGNLI